MRTSILFILLVSMSIGWSQTNNLNAYEYVIVPMEFDFQDEPNQYQINILSRVLLKENGFKVFMNTEERPMEYRGNTCESLFLEVEDTSGFLSISTVVKLKDCYDNVLFESEEGKSKIKDFREGYQQALKRAFSSLSEINYNFDPSLQKTGTKTAISTQKEDKEISGSKEEAYPDKTIYKFGGQTYWLVKNGNKDYRLLANSGKENYAELQLADKGSFIFNSGDINGAAYFDAEGNLNIEYMDEDLNEIQNMVFKRIDQ